MLIILLTFILQIDKNVITFVAMEDKKPQLIVTQSVSNGLMNEYACILLSTNVLSKEQRLMGLLMGYLDSEGMVEIIPASRDKICCEIGITNGIWKVYLSKWRKAGLITTSGYWIVFKKFITKDTQGILLCKQTNGME